MKIIPQFILCKKNIICNTKYLYFAHNGQNNAL